MTLPTFPGLAELNKLAENKGKKVRRLAQSQKLSEWKRNVALKPLKWKMVKQARRDGKGFCLQTPPSQDSANLSDVGEEFPIPLDSPTYQHDIDYLVHEIREAYEDDQIFQAQRKLDELDKIVKEGKVTRRELMNHPNLGFAKLEEDVRREAKAFKVAQSEMTTGVGWQVGRRKNGVVTRYNMDDAKRTIDLRADARINANLVFLWGLLREAGLFNRWMPFVKDSRTLKEVGRTGLLIYILFHIPVLAKRDVCMFWKACDDIENGQIILCGHHVDNMDGADIPLAPPRSWNSGRVRLRKFQVKVDVVSPTDVSISLLLQAKYNPKNRTSMCLTRYVLKEFLIGSIAVLERRAMEMAYDGEKDPVVGRMFAQGKDGMRELYWNYVFPKVFQLYKNKGWSITEAPGWEFLQGLGIPPALRSYSGIHESISLLSLASDDSTKSVCSDSQSDEFVMQKAPGLHVEFSTELSTLEEPPSKGAWLKKAFSLMFGPLMFLVFLVYASFRFYVL